MSTNKISNKISLEHNATIAIEEVISNLCVIASAGAGKTELLAQKVVHIFENGICLNPFRILAISFKRDSAESLHDRVYKRCSSESAHRFDSMTFDAFSKGLLDKFRLAIPKQYFLDKNYDIEYLSDGEVRSIFNDFELGRCISLDNFKFALNTTRLPIEDAIISPKLIDVKYIPDLKEAINNFWEKRLNEKKLTFQMINRLTCLLLTKNPHLIQAIRTTYPFVFLDEYQDTTYLQYDILKILFQTEEVKITAVGDGKQKIMGFAGAMENGLVQFEKDFNAEKLYLESNWRSVEKLVEIQEVISKLLDSNSKELKSKTERIIKGEVIKIWNYRTVEEEYLGVANWISNKISVNGINPENIAILVKQKANSLSGDLNSYFENHGLKLRNLVKQISAGIILQDLMAEQFTNILISILRLGDKQKSQKDWNLLLSKICQLRGVSEDDFKSVRKVIEELALFIAELGDMMHKDLLPGDNFEEILDFILNFINERDLRQLVQSYKRDPDYIRVKTGFYALLREYCMDSDNWEEVLDLIEGKGQIPLMTIHKSKGLEFQIVIVFGLDENNWRYFDFKNEEELNAFYVAITRAKEKVVITTLNEENSAFQKLFDILRSSNVKYEWGPS